MHHTATYSPEDNKLRLYPAHRLSADEYARVKAAGFAWAPKQEIFVAPMWTPEREDIAREFAGEIGDEDSSLMDRAEDRADRFEGYQERRTEDAERAREAVSEIAGRFEFGQPILIGHHSQRQAERDKERIEAGMRKAIKAWETAEYWQRRAAAAVRHAKYKERPDVRARRIKTIEADRRKIERHLKDQANEAILWGLVDQPEKWKPRADGTMPTREERAYYIAGRMRDGHVMTDDHGRRWSAYDIFRPAEERYQNCPALSVDEALAKLAENRAAYQAIASRWLAHYDNRLSYERAMLGEAGGLETDRKGPEVGGAVRCWASPKGGWSYIQKVNKISVTVLDNWGNGGRDFARVIPFDKITHGIMSRAEIQEAREAGRLHEVGAIGFILKTRAPEPIAAPKGTTPADIQAMRETLKTGITVATVPQLFPTPAHVAKRMIELADIWGLSRVLEPSAGTGVLIEWAIGKVQKPIVAVEINRALVDALKNRWPGLNARCADFLECNDLGQFDRIIMNPPFANADDVKHIKHAAAMLAPGGRLVAICANGPRQREALRDMATHWEDLPAGTFAESGTMVNTALLVIDN